MPLSPLNQAAPWLALLTLALSACAVVNSARLALPEPLAATPELSFAGAGHARQGQFTLDGHAVRFERGADSLSLFGRYGSERNRLSFTVDGVGQGRCDGRATQATAGIVQVPLAPYALRCELQLADGTGPAELLLNEQRTAAGTRLERRGQLRRPGLVIEILSLHTLQGSALPLPHPAGYLLRHEGRPVAAVDLTGTEARLHRHTGTPAAAELRHATTLAAVALGLSWDPANAGS